MQGRFNLSLSEMDVQLINSIGRIGETGNLECAPSSFTYRRLIEMGSAAILRWEQEEMDVSMNVLKGLLTLCDRVYYNAVLHEENLCKRDDGNDIPSNVTIAIQHIVNHINGTLLLSAI